jgi:hypothetical protein
MTACWGVWFRAERALIEGTLAGLRFVRNRIGRDDDLAEFVEPAASGPGAGNGGVTDSAWKSVPGSGARASAARAGVGDEAISRIPGSAGGLRCRAGLRPAVVA